MLKPTVVAGTIATACFATGAALAGDSPEVVRQKQQYIQAYRATIAYGACETYADFKQWQEANWPEGQATREAFLREKVLPQYSTDAAALKSKTFLELESGYLQMCSDALHTYQQVMDALSK